MKAAILLCVSSSLPAADITSTIFESNEFVRQVSNSFLRVFGGDVAHFSDIMARIVGSAQFSVGTMKSAMIVATRYFGFLSSQLTVIASTDPGVIQTKMAIDGFLTVFCRVASQCSDLAIYRNQEWKKVVAEVYQTRQQITEGVEKIASTIGFWMEFAKTKMDNAKTAEDFASAALLLSAGGGFFPIRRSTFRAFRIGSGPTANLSIADGDSVLWRFFGKRGWR
jgi:hypothetical protein